MNRSLILGLSILVGCVWGCSSDNETSVLGNNRTIEVPDTYSFTSQFADASPDTNNVAYTGQTHRHLLTQGLKNEIALLVDRIDANATKDDALASLTFYYLFDEAGLDKNIDISVDGVLLQESYRDLSGDKPKNLQEKVAGNDATGQYKDWNAGGQLVGWDDPNTDRYRDGRITPDNLIAYWLNQIADAAVKAKAGETALDPEGNPVPVEKYFVTAEGHDLQQLVQKFIDGSVAFSQAADDYLDDDTDDKGLLSDNSQGSDDAPYSTLERAWDEAFGYFGAARDSDIYSLEAIAGKSDSEKPYRDSNSDGRIDLSAEYHLGHSINAAKRDIGSSEPKTTFKEDAFRAFRRGRAIINQAAGRDLSDQEMTLLKEERDKALANWEKAIAATAVHYINDVIADLNALGTDDYSFTDAAKHWSELKGFSLALQFNPHSPVLAKLAELHTLIGMQLVTEASEVASYTQKLLAARDILKEAYAFSQSNVEGW